MLQISRRMRLPGRGLWGPVVMVGLVAVLAGGCGHGGPPQTSGSGAAIKAEPNPVPSGPGGKGTTKITWTTGDGSVGQVYVAHDGAQEKLFADNRANGKLEAAWIGTGNYEFRLYAGRDKKKLLASVTVTKK